MTTKIEWTDETWNPVTGCTKVSPGCKHCYAERLHPKVEGARVAREGGEPRPFTAVRCHPERLDQPLRWRRPRRIFVNSMSDLFHEDVPDDFLDRVFAVMGTCRWHTFQVLTKRPARMLEWFSERWQPAPETTQRAIYEHLTTLGTNLAVSPLPPFVLDTTGEDRADQVYGALESLPFCTDPSKDHLYTPEGQSNVIAQGWPFSNVWLGVSAEDQNTFDERVEILGRVPAAVRFVSAEPLLGDIDCGNAFDDPPDDSAYGKIHWLIAGGESGPSARPMHPDWARSLRDQCAAAGVPFFFTQLGEWWEAATELRNDDGTHHEVAVPSLEADEWFSKGDCLIAPDGRVFTSPATIPPDVPCRHMLREGKRAAGRILDGRTHDEYPA